MSPFTEIKAAIAVSTKAAIAVSASSDIQMSPDPSITVKEPSYPCAGAQEGGRATKEKAGKPAKPVGKIPTIKTSQPIIRTLCPSPATFLTDERRARARTLWPGLNVDAVSTLWHFAHLHPDVHNPPAAHHVRHSESERVG